ncbi:MAG: GNAT family N-acetyltransferase [Chthoniobacteraceae bacterium]
MAIHRGVFGGALNHVTFGWDEPAPGFIDEFIAAGFRTSNGLALSMSAYDGGVSVNQDLTVRPLRETSEWEAMLEQQMHIDREDFGYPEDGGFFRRTQMKSLRALAEAGHGDWWGAFHGSELIGGMGLYFDEERTVGRFQYVTTRASRRRQRVCTTLLDRAVRHAFETVKVKQLVICTGADDKNPAIPTYRNFGFRETVSSYALTRRD